MTVAVRRIRAHEWRRVRALRLTSLRDPLAHLAFLETHDEASAWTESRWRARARRGAEGDSAAQFVAHTPDAWVGTVTVLVFREGDLDYYGVARTEDAAVLVGVYVDPDWRGRGVLERLVDEAATWALELGFASLHLDVHPDHPRARRAYERLGFVDTGERIDSDGVLDIRMARDLTRR